VEWSVPKDIEFKAVYLRIGEGEAEQPDEIIKDHKTSDRLATSHRFGNLEPDTSYQVRLTFRDGLGRNAFSDPIQVRTLRNQPPMFIFLEPDGVGDETDEGMTIRWTSSDPDGIANYTLSYDDDLDPSDQVFLYKGDTSMNGGEGETFFNTTTLPSGGYTINATIDDQVNPPITVYSLAIIVKHRTVMIDHPGVLSCVVEGGRESAFRDPVIDVVFTKAMSPTTLDRESVYIIDGQTFMRKEGSITMTGTSTLEWRPRTALPG
jgi:hypothetical protein